MRSGFGFYGSGAVLRCAKCALLRSVALAGLLCCAGIVTSRAQEAPSASAPPGTSPAPAGEVQPQLPPQTSPAATGQYDPAIFVKRIPADQLAGLAQFDGAPTSELMRDKQFRKVLKSVAPDCMFHYGYDMPLEDALSRVMADSRVPVRVREGRYLVAGGSAPMLAGRGFVWIDLKDGVGAGGFFFHPTNGEPTPSLAVFSRQVKEEQLAMGDLPPAFAVDLQAWSDEARVPAVVTRYFLTGSNKRVLLEHDEDYCSPANGAMAGAGDTCQMINADAADVDETAAYYLDQVHYRTNATAWMIGEDQVAWLSVRDRTCGGVVDPLGCRIRVTREHTHLILGGGRPLPRPVHR